MTGMKVGIGLLASAVPTARTAAGRPISRATHPYGRTSPRGISRVLRSTACSNEVRPRRSNRIRWRPCSSSSILTARSCGGSAAHSCRPTSLRNQSSNSAAEAERAAADTPCRFHATYTVPSTVSKRAYESVIPTWASRRSANPAGAFTSPSSFRSVVRVVIVVSSQQFESPMHVRLHRPNRLPQRVRRLLVRKLLDVAQDDGLAITRGKPRHPHRQRIHLHLQQSAFLRADRVVWLAPIQLDQARPHAPRSVAHHVECDPVQPGFLPQLPDPVGRICDERAIRAQERVLGDLFGVVAIACQGEAEREDPVLVLMHHPLEQALSAVHHSPQHRYLHSGCKVAEP